MKISRPVHETFALTKKNISPESKQLTDFTDARISIK